MSRSKGGREIGCLGKKKFKTTQEAAEYMRSLVDDGKARKELHVYHCTFCLSWHVGAKEPKTPEMFRDELIDVGKKLQTALANKDYTSASRAQGYKLGLERGLYIYQTVAGHRYQEVQEARKWARLYRQKHDALEQGLWNYMCNVINHYDFLYDRIDYYRDLAERQAT